MRQDPGQRSAMGRGTETRNKWFVLWGGGWLIVEKVKVDIFHHIIYTHSSYDTLNLSNPQLTT